MRDVLASGAKFLIYSSAALVGVMVTCWMTGNWDKHEEVLLTFWAAYWAAWVSRNVDWKEGER